MKVRTAIEQDERHDYCSGLEIHPYLTLRPPEPFREDARDEGGEYAVNICYADTQSDESEHVRASMDYRMPHPHEERLRTPEHYRGGQNELYPFQNRMVCYTPDRDKRDIVPHGYENQRNCQNGADLEPTGHVNELRVLLFLCRNGLRLKGHSADRTVPRGIAYDLGVHGTGPFDLCCGFHRFCRLQRHAALGT
jgi:hypothetical protein